MHIPAHDRGAAPARPPSPATGGVRRLRGAGGGPVPDPAYTANFEKTRPSARTRDAVFRRLLAAGDILAAFVAMGLATVVLGDSELGWPSLLGLVLVVVIYKVAGLYDRDEVVLHKATLEEAPALLQASTMLTLLLVVADRPFIQGDLSDRQLFGIWVLLLCFSLLARMIARRVARRVTPPERCLVLGDALSAERLRTKFESVGSVRALVLGRVPLEREVGSPPDRPLGSLDDLVDLIAEHDVQRVVIAPGATDFDALLGVVQSVKSLGVKVSVLPRMFEVVGSSVEFDDVGGMLVLGIRRFGLTRSSAAVKRGLDVFGAGAGLVLLAPLLLAIAAAVRLTSPGPVLFRQTRIGRDGQPFTMLKFRTMCGDAEQRKAELAELNEATGLFKIERDPRITRVGGLLRRTSLDELPQLLNVLRGQMSLVGPRPLIGEEDSQVEGWHRRRLHLKPGMTGHWQILGSARIPLHEMVTIDYLYVANWSLWNDVKILLRTVPYVAGLRGM